MKNEIYGVPYEVVKYLPDCERPVRKQIDEIAAEQMLQDLGYQSQRKQGDVAVHEPYGFSHRHVLIAVDDHHDSLDDDEVIEV